MSAWVKLVCPPEPPPPEPPPELPLPAQLMAAGAVFVPV
jgi:hypothetical protein